MKSLCPRCGYDVCDDQPIVLGDFSMDGAGFPLFYKGERIRLTPAESDIVWTLLKAYPRPVKLDVLLDRMDSEGTPNTGSVLICRVRSKLVAIASQQPIETIRARGYRWHP